MSKIPYDIQVEQVMATVPAYYSTADILDAEQVAEHILRCSASDPDVTVSLNRMQHILYRAQGHYLAEYGKPLFKDDFVAAVHGMPSAPALEAKYRKRSERIIRWTGKAPHLRLRKQKRKEEFLPLDIQVFLGDMWLCYGAMDINALRSGMLRYDSDWASLPQYRRTGFISRNTIQADFLIALEDLKKMPAKTTQ